VANSYYSGTVYVDTSGAVVSNAAKVAYITFRGAAADDAIVIRDGDGNTDPIKFSAILKDAKTTQVFDYSANPIVFKDGIYVTITSGAVATIQTTTQGANS
jgi:hypothetical protein